MGALCRGNSAAAVNVSHLECERFTFYTLWANAWLDAKDLDFYVPQKTISCPWADDGAPVNDACREDVRVSWACVYIYMCVCVCVCWGEGWWSEAAPCDLQHDSTGGLLTSAWEQGGLFFFFNLKLKLFVILFCLKSLKLSLVSFQTVNLHLINLTEQKSQTKKKKNQKKKKQKKKTPDQSLKTCWSSSVKWNKTCLVGLSSLKHHLEAGERNAGLLRLGYFSCCRLASLWLSAGLHVSRIVG